MTGELVLVAIIFSAAKMKPEWENMSGKAMKMITYPILDLKGIFLWGRLVWLIEKRYDAIATAVVQMDP